MQTAKPVQILTQESGQMTIDFLVSIVIAFGLFIIFFALTYTLTTVEVTQYIAFASARAQSGGNATAAAQAQAANDKFKQLVQTNTALSKLYNTGWFGVGTTAKGGGVNLSGLVVKQGDTNTFVGSLGGTGSQFQKVFTGVSIPFGSSLLEFQVPFISNGTNDEDGGTRFKTNVNAILVREPSMDECQSFWKSRIQYLMGLPSGQVQKIQQSAYVPMEDNGC